ncbi:hypothetical protein [Rhodospirillum sp. A1_3_36]|uniref:DUF7683 domain-containing protein n=1 Tax=Rhodospirillum sp. A1_3_36 TaxID=3391666 RepID=UPI0039A6CE6C
MAIKRYLRGFSYDTERVIKEIDISYIDINSLKELFSEDHDDDIYGMIPITETLSSVLTQKHGVSPLDQNLDWYFDSEIE